MQITHISIRLADEHRVMAYVDIVFDEVFKVHSLRIIRQSEGLYLAMPDRQLTKFCPLCGLKIPKVALKCICGKTFSDEEARRFVDVCHPISQEFRTYMETTIIAEYERVCYDQN